MLKQLQSGGARTAIRHDGRMLRVYRGRLSVDAVSPPASFRALPWSGEKRLEIPALGGVVTFARAPYGVDLSVLKDKPFFFRLRSGGERLQPDPKRPRRTLKNLFQEAGVPPHERDRLPLLFCGDALVWVPGLGVDARFQARGGTLPRWRAKT
jgi:tRNA(Ile)-lysidine synthase